MDTVTVRGVEVPALGLGTYRLRGQEGVEAITRALELGYRHVDTAEYYDNQAEVGEALARADVDVADVFVTTKIWQNHLGREDVRRVATEARKRLGVDSIDLLLIHWPSRSVPIEETIGAMNALQRDGVVEHVGVSNFSVAQLREAMAASETPILTNQVQYNPTHLQNETLTFCIDNDVLLTAYSPLAKGRVIEDGLLASIGERYGKSASQVALRWLVQQPMVAAIPKATSERHLRSNLDVFDFELTDAEMRDIFDRAGEVPAGLSLA